MHMYKIPRGTRAVLYTVATNATTPWIVRKDLSFIETVIDPIKSRNGQLVDIKAMNTYADKGWAVFGSTYGCERGEPYYLFVQYSDIKVS